jgi:hypothetical protein
MNDDLKVFWFVLFLCAGGACWVFHKPAPPRQCIKTETVDVDECVSRDYLFAEGRCGKWAHTKGEKCVEYAP